MHYCSRGFSGNGGGDVKRENAVRSQWFSLFWFSYLHDVLECQITMVVMLLSVLGPIIFSFVGYLHQKRPACRYAENRWTSLKP